MNVATHNDRLTRALRDAAPAVWDWDIAKQELVVTTRVREIYGFCAQSKLGIRDLIEPILTQDRQKILQSNGELKPVQNIRYRINNPIRGIRWVKTKVVAENQLSEPFLVAGFTGTIEDVTDEIFGTQALLESEERLRFAVEAGKMAIWENDLETGTITITPELNAMFGFPKEAKPSLSELRSRYAPGELEKVGKLGATWEVVKERIANGQLNPRQIIEPAENEDRMQVQADLSIIVPPGITKHLLYRAQYVYSLEGRPRITGFLVDVTEQRRAEEQLAVIARELRHRVRNSFAVVQALATQTFRSDQSIETMLQTYLARIYALSLANDVVLDTEAGDADLSDIIQRIISPYRNRRADSFVLEGPPIRIVGRCVTALSMVLHELCTNAVKYGALSRAERQVQLLWHTAEQGRIAMNWKEQGGPPVIVSDRKGFGTKLLKLMVTDTLSGTMDMDFRHTGLNCEICIGDVIVK